MSHDGNKVAHPEYRSARSLGRDKETGCSALAKRWCELFAGCADGLLALSEARKELGMRPGRDHTQRALLHLMQQRPAVIAYRDQCKADIAKYFPGGEVPAWMSRYWSQKPSKYRCPGELKAKSDEYFESKESEEGGRIELNELCMHLGVSWATLFKYAVRDEEWWETVNGIKTRCAAYINSLMMTDAKLAHACNYMLNRMDIPEHPAQAERHRAEVERARAEMRALDKGVEVADQLAQFMQELHGNGGRRFIPSSIAAAGNIAGLDQRQLIGPDVASDQPVLDR